MSVASRRRREGEKVGKCRRAVVHIRQNVTFLEEREFPVCMILFARQDLERSSTAFARTRADNLKH
eukprot:1846759-Pyramimonas_sp.AAC.1